MTIILGGVLTIGVPHGLRSGVNNPDTVLTLRRDKRTAWRRSSINRRRSGDDPRPPSTLWLETRTYTYYSFKHILTDALIWWVDHERLGIDTSTVSELRACSQMEHVDDSENLRKLLFRARETVETAALSDDIAIFLALATGDQPAVVFPPPKSDLWAGIQENLRNLDIQYEIAAPIAARMSPGMGKKPVVEVYQTDGTSLVRVDGQIPMFR